MINDIIQGIETITREKGKFLQLQIFDEQKIILFQGMNAGDRLATELKEREIQYGVNEYGNPLPSGDDYLLRGAARAWIVPEEHKIAFYGMNLSYPEIMVNIPFLKESNERTDWCLGYGTVRPLKSLNKVTWL